ncbi:Uncharacterized protein FKW44_004861 [Caligus rogercresseyi]|uniref:Uncharacterized protein n=1 Tax=Caligus rogercresseyi TaxID=217165 RepID=A0A7T8KB58_CALRO|nr:Uncharacterized protein FKW44_004861 [Caligus rogercresseyi]
MLCAHRVEPSKIPHTKAALAQSRPESFWVPSSSSSSSLMCDDDGHDALDMMSSALESMDEESVAKWRRLFVRDAESQSWKLQYDPGKDLDDLLKNNAEGDSESIHSSSSSNAASSSSSLQSASSGRRTTPFLVFCSLKPNVSDLRRRNKKRKCIRLPVSSPPRPPQGLIPSLSTCLLLTPPTCQIPLFDVFQDSPLSSIHCAHCQKPYSSLNSLSVDFRALSVDASLYDSSLQEKYTQTSQCSTLL